MNPIPLPQACRNLNVRLPVIMMFAASLLLSACGGSSNSKSPATGTASVDITDAPVDDVIQVHLTVHRISLKPESGPAFDYIPDEPIVVSNLLDLQGTNAAPLLPDSEVRAGRYNWIRLYISGGFPDSYVVTDEGGSVDLFIPGQQGMPSDDTRFLQLVSGFIVPAGGNADFTLEVDLRRALTKPNGSDHYLLRPALRITDNTDTGSLSGSVDAALLSDESCTNDLVSDTGNAVYLFSGSDAIPNDVHIDDAGVPIGDNNPLTTANVTLDVDSGLYVYSIGFVPAGDYTVALTCQSLDDMPDQDDAILFLQTQDTAVIAEQNTEANFTQ